MKRKLFTRQGQRRLIVTLFLILCTISIGGYVSSQEAPSEETPTESGYEWLVVPMTNAITGETFTLADYIKTGSPVVIHTFAIWCPACNMQLKESTTFLNTFSGKAHIIGIDVNEAESMQAIAAHIEKNGFGGIFATAPKELSQGLINTFGPQTILQMPHSIIIVGGDIFYLGPGVRPAGGLSAVIDDIYATIAKNE